MTKKERIEELERKVAQLEGERHAHYMPWAGIIPPSEYNCAACGERYRFGHYHFCSPPIWTGSGNISGTANFPIDSITYSGATS